MQPTHELLARIRWDAQYAKSRFVIGYWDRVAERLLRADLREIAWDADNPSIFATDLLYVGVRLSAQANAGPNLTGRLRFRELGARIVVEDHLQP